MEMISYICFGLALLLSIPLVIRAIDRRLRTVPTEKKLRPLSDPAVRSELSGFLRAQMVLGDADIREGIVFPPVPASRLDPLAVILSRAFTARVMMQNPDADALYFRHNGEYRLAGFDLSDVAEAASVMSRVAEDRRKSRSLYKGMTDDEIKALVRAGLSSWLKDDGQFAESNEVMSGLWDDKPEFLMAVNVMDLAFKVKGARND